MSDNYMPHYYRAILELMETAFNSTIWITRVAYNVTKFRSVAEMTEIMQ